MYIRRKLLILFLTTITLANCSSREIFNPGLPVRDENNLLIVQKLIHQDFEGKTGGLEIKAPFDEAVFPPEIAAPEFLWEDDRSGADYWLIVVEMDDRLPLYFFSNQPKWFPEKETWESIKKHCVETPAIISITGFNNTTDPAILSKNTIRIFTSKDRVDALVLYRQVQLPFMVGEENFRKIKWRLGDITSCEEPPVIMENIPVCASCHQVSADGLRISMEMNYNNDSGAQFITDVGKNIILSQADFMTWSDYPKSDILPKTRGLFARISPSGKYIAGTVNEISFAALTNDPAYCQAFFPTYGILACYSVAEKIFFPLNGADDTNFIQTNPEWCPDEQYITFARAQTKNEYHEDISNIKTRIEDRSAEDINQEFPVKFNLWKMPFNNGRGGTPKPLAGASDNGMSNYFARYSPDGRWIVFTQSKHGIMLQPDSRLFIVPSEGGSARKMSCNQNEFNSWHSWSPNARWLLFSSKVNSIYTEIFITHIDKNGNDSVPVCLSRFSDRSLAANLPEFVSLNAGQIQKIQLGN
jgi:WD40 repeat protein